MTQNSILWVSIESCKEKNTETKVILYIVHHHKAIDAMHQSELEATLLNWLNLSA